VTGRAHQPGTPERGAEELAQAFEAQRLRLLRVAYATRGSLGEAEDCVQEAWLTVVSCTIDRGRITALDVIRNPDKLAAVRELAD
jgi:DNA-directed RNA polymerase specialized sigma24 family protein